MELGRTELRAPRRLIRSTFGMALPVLFALGLPQEGRSLQEEPLGEWSPGPTHETARERALADLVLLGGLPPDDRAGWVTLQELRTEYFLSIEEEPRVERAASRLRALRPEAGPELTRTLDAFEGALEVLRGKHALWPRTKLRHLRAGLAILDRTLALDPGDPELRYLRLVSTWYLPALFGRRETAREDLAVLAAELPAAAPGLPPALAQAMAEFLLATGRLEAAERAAVQGVRDRADRIPAGLRRLAPPAGPSGGGRS